MKWNLVAALLVTALGVQGANAQSVGNVLTGGAKVEVLEHERGTQGLPKPDKVVIHDLAVPIDDVTTDHSLAARLHRTRLKWSGMDEDSTPQVLAQHLHAAFSKALAGELANEHIATEKAGTATADNAGTILVVDGKFTAINEGNRTKRVMIGFGSGTSDIKAHIVVSASTAGHSTVVLAFDMNSQSGKMPGALPTAGAGSLLVGTGVGVAGDTGSTVEADASRMGKLVAKQIEALMTTRERIPGSTAKAVNTASAPASAS